ncbi:hypothetical protein [Candidatus Phytoplasma sp. AldY-WA1]|uniref:hypothetical protein n=1 Tax=Candidatus Phytoplasma sp. AldY-WA1 TaxID=2852100 RepID=UPI0025514B3A|nr:hypothetical protein [Candidatus Phytoplasma sp. AldY-WA1]
MTLRALLSLCGIGICVVFGLYMFGFIQPNKENLDFLVEKQPKTEKKQPGTPSNPPSNPPSNTQGK